MALAAKPSWRPRFAIALLILQVIGTGSALVAMASGDELAARVGTPARHEQLGQILGFSSIAMLLVAGGWLWWVRRDERPTAAQNVAGWAAAAVGLVIVGLTVAVGHSGATAAWSDAVAPATAEPAPTATTTVPTTTESAAASATPSRIGTPPATTIETPTPEPSPGYTLAQLADHNTADNCWAAIGGNMYDLTQWIPRHPGGANRIVELCGTDATIAFQRQHGNAAEPNSELAQFLLGPISGPASPPTRRRSGACDRLREPTRQRRGVRDGGTHDDGERAAADGLGGVGWLVHATFDQDGRSANAMISSTASQSGPESWGARRSSPPASVRGCPHRPLGPLRRRRPNRSRP